MINKLGSRIALVSVMTTPVSPAVPGSHSLHATRKFPSRGQMLARGRINITRSARCEGVTLVARLLQYRHENNTNLFMCRMSVLLNIMFHALMVRFQLELF